MSNRTLTTVSTTENKAQALFGIVEKLSVAKNADPQKISELLSIWERLNATQARADFDAAIAEAKAKLPIVVKDNEVFLGGGRSYAYEDLASIAKAIDPILAQHGLTYRFHTTSTIDTVTVTCRLSHVGGHYEETTLTAGLDKGASRNALQSLGSSCTYLSRYTLKAALGLAASKDTDANAVVEPVRTISNLSKVLENEKPAFVNAGQIQELRDLLRRADKEEEKLCKLYKVTKIQDFTQDAYEAAVERLETIINSIEVVQ